MANVEINDLTAKTTPLRTDEIEVQATGGGASAKATFGDVLDAFVNGKQEMWVPAADMRPTVSNGCDAVADFQTTSGRPDIQAVEFVNTADEFAQFQVAFPKRWNRGTITYQVFWTVVGAVTTGIAIVLQGVAVSDGGTIDVAYPAAGTPVTDDAQGTTEELFITPVSEATTIGGTPADDDVVFFQLSRDVSDANDDMTQKMKVIGIKIFWTTDAAIDD